MEFSAVANREVRIIPKGWQHPRRPGQRGAVGKEGYWPLHNASWWPRPGYEQYFLAEMELEEMPRREDVCMPPVEGLPPEATEIVAYETTTEGTPISAAFPNTPEGKLALANWCAEKATTFGDHRADAETWAAILFGEDQPLVGQDGSVRF